MERERREVICLGVLASIASDRCRTQKLHWCCEVVQGAFGESLFVIFDTFPTSVVRCCAFPKTWQ